MNETILDLRSMILGTFRRRAAQSSHCYGQLVILIRFRS
jgi:hypothetical protein